MSDPDIWMPLFIRAFLTKTAHLSGEQAGAYAHLLMHSWVIGPLPDDDAKLARMSRFSLRVWRSSLRSEVMSFFDLGPNGWTQKRLEIERLKAMENSHVKANAAKARWLKTQETRDAHAYAQAMQETCSSPSPSPVPSKAPSEKRRGAADAATKRAFRLPDDWKPALESTEKCLSLGLELERTVTMFRNYFQAVGGEKGRKLNWDQTFENWCLNDRSARPVSRVNGNHAPQRSTTEKNRFDLLTDIGAFDAPFVEGNAS